MSEEKKKKHHTQGDEKIQWKDLTKIQEERIWAVTLMICSFSSRKNFSVRCVQFQNNASVGRQKLFKYWDQSTQKCNFIPWFHWWNIKWVPSWEGRLPRWLSGKEFACQYRRCRRCRFHPWVRKIPRGGNGNPTPMGWPGERHGQRRLAWCHPWSCENLGDWCTQAGKETATHESVSETSSWNTSFRSKP